MKQRAKVEIGQRYQSVGAVTGTPVFTYRVEELFHSKIDNVEYARLVQIGDLSRSKSVASSILSNPRHFLPVAAEIADKTDQAA